MKNMGAVYLDVLPADLTQSLGLIPADRTIHCLVEKIQQPAIQRFDPLIAPPSLETALFQPNL